MYVWVWVMKLQIVYEGGKGILKEGRRAERVREHVWHTLLYFKYTLLLGLPTTYLCSRTPNVLATQGLPCRDLDRLSVFALLTGCQSLFHLPQKAEVNPSYPLEPCMRGLTGMRLGPTHGFQHPTELMKKGPALHTERRGPLCLNHFI